MSGPHPFEAAGWKARRDVLKIAGTGAAVLAAPALFPINAVEAKSMTGGPENFYKSDAVEVEKVRFRTQYHTEVVGNLFRPKGLDTTAKHPALVVSHPMGAVKEQAANLYATKMAEKGFVALAFDMPFWGESEGEMRNAAAPEHYAEAFSAAVDFLGTRPFVDRARIGGIGVCASGGFLISAAKIDPRLRAIATTSMVDMGGAARNFVTPEQRRQIAAASAQQRWVEADGGAVAYTGGTVDELSPDTDPMQREFYSFYRTPRGEFTPAGATKATTTHPTLSSNTKFLNFYPFNDIDSISPRPILIVSGDKAFSRGFSEEAFKLAAEPKKFVSVAGANHVDLYDRTDLIPFDRLAAYFTEHLA